MRELQSLEQQLDTAIKRIRTRKDQLMHESISELQKKEKVLQQQNNQLTKKLKENEKNMADRAQWEQQSLGQNSTTFVLPQPEPPQLLLPSLSIGGTFQGQEAITGENGGRARPGSNPPMPSWLLRHANK
ncbi:unnamed protein product [Ilex paraguariensis]